MDAERYSGIDFANSKSDSYNATNADVMSELNAYFKSYIANVGGNDERDIQKTLDGILHESTFDDAIDAIHRDKYDNSDSDQGKHFDDEDNYNEVEQNMLDVEVLDQHIDKYGLTGGSDATRAIENMAGGALNHEPFEGEKDEYDATHEDFANNMLGMQGGDVRVSGNGMMKGYSGVTNEIRVKGNRVSERSRNAYNYRSEDGRLDMGMLGGSFEDAAANDDEDAESNVAGDIILIGTNEDSDKEYESEYDDYSDNEETTQPSSSMASEIDLVLNQLRNKTARTLTGGTVNIRKKVVLTDMYPYIVRS